MEIHEPFAGYKDFADCVAKNKSKSDPKAYCATIMRKVEKPKHSFDFQFSSPVITELKGEGADKKMFIVGNAVSAGMSRNKTFDGKNIEYRSEELEKSAKGMIGIPLMINHEDDDVRNIVGKVVDARFENGSIPYKALI